MSAFMDPLTGVLFAVLAASLLAPPGRRDRVKGALFVACAAAAASALLGVGATWVATAAGLGLVAGVFPPAMGPRASAEESWVGGPAGSGEGDYRGGGFAGGAAYGRWS